MRYGEPAAAGAGGDVHDGATAGLDHFRNGEARAQIRAGQARVDRVAPVLHEVLLHALGRPAVAGVVDERVDLAERLDPGGDQSPYIVLDRSVAHHRDCPSVSRLHVGHGLLHQIRGAGRADHARALAREPEAEGATDALGRAGDDRHLVVEQTHGLLLWAGGEREEWGRAAQLTTGSADKMKAPGCHHPAPGDAAARYALRSASAFEASTNSFRRACMTTLKAVHTVVESLARCEPRVARPTGDGGRDLPAARGARATFSSVRPV